MGAEYFQVKATGNTIDDAFQNAVAEARSQIEDDDGYSGTLAEKTDYQLHPNLMGLEPKQFISYILDADEDADDKWGPANAIEVGPNTWIFFGYASS